VERLERLVNLVVALLDTRRPLTRDELRQRVGGYSEDEDNFRRNFERDKEMLRQMGIPVVAEPVDPRVPESATGYRVPRDQYELPEPGLDDDELMALGLAASAVVFEGSVQGAATTALWKLTAASRGAPGTGPGTDGTGGSTVRGAGEPPAVPAPGSVPVVDVAVDPIVAVLFSAVAEKRTVRFTYNGLDRRVDPYRLSYRQGKWYLAGFDHGREGERLFRADRVKGPVTVDERPGTFLRPVSAPSGPPPPWRLGDDEEVVVDLRVDATQAPWVRSLAGPDAVVGTGPDGTVSFKLPVTNRAAFRSFVLGLLDHAEVVGPRQVRDEILEWLGALASAAPGLAPVPAS
jgi:predicted DNA-binding transcriptional regulator YafY